MDTLIGVTGSSLALGGTFLLYLTLTILVARLLKPLAEGRQGSEKP
jgi:hypothetical protein